MKYFVYVLRSIKFGTFYTGISRDPEQRLKEHNSGYSRYTKGRRPYQLLYKEEFSSRILAREREKYLKSGVGRKYLKDRFPCSSVGRAGGC